MTRCRCVKYNAFLVSLLSCRSPRNCLRCLWGTRRRARTSFQRPWACGTFSRRYIIYVHTAVSQVFCFVPLRPKSGYVYIDMCTAVSWCRKILGVDSTRISRYGIIWYCLAWDGTRWDEMKWDGREVGDKVRLCFFFFHVPRVRLLDDTAVLNLKRGRRRGRMIDQIQVSIPGPSTQNPWLGGNMYFFSLFFFVPMEATSSSVCRSKNPLPWK